MQYLKRINLALIFLVNTSLMFGCNNAGNATSDMAPEKAPVEKNETISVTSSKPGQAQADLDKAKKAGKAVFLVITGTGATDIDKALAIAKEASQQFKNSAIIQMNRDDTDNAALVTKFRLADAPVPLLLVISPKGVPTGGYVLSDATAERLVQLVPSPKMDDIYTALNDGKAVFLVVSKKSFTDKTKILESCKAAVAQMEKSAIIEVDVDDKKEGDFLKQLNLQSKPNTTTTIVLNSAGQTTGSFEGFVATTDLLAAAKKIIRGGCCPGGSSSCGPKK